MKNKNQSTMFATADLPLFSGTAQTATNEVFKPKAVEYQTGFFKCKICKDTGIVGTVWTHRCTFCEAWKNK